MSRSVTMLEECNAVGVAQRGIFRNTKSTKCAKRFVLRYSVRPSEDYSTFGLRTTLDALTVLIRGVSRNIPNRGFRLFRNLVFSFAGAVPVGPDEAGFFDPLTKHYGSKSTTRTVVCGAARGDIVAETSRT